MVKIALDKAEFAPPAVVFLQHVGAGDVRRHQVGRDWMRLKPMSRMRASVLTIKVLASPGTPTADNARAVKMAARLLDHVALADDDLLQFFLHELPMLADSCRMSPELRGLVAKRRSLSRRPAPAVTLLSRKRTAMIPLPFLRPLTLISSMQLILYAGPAASNAAARSGRCRCDF